MVLQKSAKATARWVGLMVLYIFVEGCFFLSRKDEDQERQKGSNVTNKYILFFLFVTAEQFKALLYMLSTLRQ